jgi:hypothetical protein
LKALRFRSVRRSGLEAAVRRRITIIGADGAGVPVAPAVVVADQAAVRVD